jgi:cytochrome d ubiquinol oxidase subunit II
MSLGEVWFVIVAFAFTMYVVLDGFDLGAGALHLLVARTPTDRMKVLKSIGPVWDGNEVWLLAGGGLLYLAYPLVYASSFSGFYLALMVVLWLLILRGISIEVRGHLEHPVWAPFWDVVFCLSSLLLTFLFGVALGNVVRGVPLNAEGWFFIPLWTHFHVASDPGLFDWYTLASGATTTCALARHGALWLVLKNDGDLRERALKIAARLWWPTLVSALALTALTFEVQPQVSRNLSDHVWGVIFPIGAILGLVTSKEALLNQRELCAFGGSALFLFSMMGSAAFGIFPYLLPSITDPVFALSIQGTAVKNDSLRIALFWLLPGVILTVIYFAFLYRRFSGKISL